MIKFIQLINECGENILKKGISLIVLVITIIVIIILAGSVILSLSQNTPITSATEAAFKTTVEAYNSQLTMAISKKYVTDFTFDKNGFNAGVWDGTVGNTLGTIKEYIPSITAVDGAKFEIQCSKLVYVGDIAVEKSYTTQVGVSNKLVLGIGTIATDNSTVDGKVATYKNPIIPIGFRAINSGTNWPTNWNLGLVIEDASGNQFVWVPVDGTNVKYEKWCTIGLISYNVTTDDVLPIGINNELDQIKNYGGFYIARYESMFDYNAGNIRVASKKNTNKTNLIWTRDTAHTGFLWNFVNYADGKSYSQSMAGSYGYDTTKVMTGLITGTQWDTLMKWIQNSSKSVTDSRSWGNNNNSITPANVAGSASLQISGFSEFWKSNNIYDISGNAWELTSEKYNSQFVGRGSSYNYDGLTYPVSFRYNADMSTAHDHMTFRTTLYIK
jgi:hypothetical protein